MLFRDHPLMTYRGIRSWPPVWTWVDGPENKHPSEEVGILQEVLPSDVEPADRCFLYIEHEGLTYVGCLMIEDHDFCRHTLRTLQGCCNHPIAEIGALDLTYNFSIP